MIHTLVAVHACQRGTAPESLDLELELCKISRPNRPQRPPSGVCKEPAYWRVSRRTDRYGSDLPSGNAHAQCFERTDERLWPSKLFFRRRVPSLDSRLGTCHFFFFFFFFNSGLLLTACYRSAALTATTSGTACRNRFRGRSSAKGRARSDFDRKRAYHVRSDGLLCRARHSGFSGFSFTFPLFWFENKIKY